MEAWDVAKKYRTHHGSKLIGYADVALPVHRLFTTCVLHEQSSLTPIEEFVFRSAHIGIDTKSDIASVLGLSESLVNSCLSELVRASLITAGPDGRVVVTSTGKEAVTDYTKNKPTSRSVVFDIDGITGRVTWYRNRDLFSPSEAKKLGLTLIRPIPAKRPEKGEIDLSDVSRYLTKANTSTDREATILRIKGIKRNARLFYHAVMLVFRDEHTRELAVTFAIDSVISHEHEKAFLEKDGIKKERIKDDTPQTDIDSLQKEIAGLLGLEDRKLKLGLRKSRLSPDNSAAPILDQLLSLSKYEVSFEPFDYPHLVSECLNRAKRNLILMSPTTTERVVDGAFLHKIRKLVRSGVMVTIIFNPLLTDSNDGLSSLQEIAHQNRNLKILHAQFEKTSLILVDSAKCLITTFGLLSYLGHHDLVFREHRAFVVKDQSTVDSINRRIGEVSRKRGQIYFSDRDV